MPPLCIRSAAACTHRPQQGYVLFDALAALLLLTGTLLGAGLALVQSLSGSRAAALQTLAVELAADLTESLYGTVQRDRVIEDWTLQVARQLPAGSATTGISEDADPASASMLAVLISWRDKAGQIFQLQLPFALPEAAP